MNIPEQNEQPAQVTHLKWLQHRCLVIIPALNEQESIAQTINELKRLELPLTILVVNDGSKDQTAQKAEKAGAVVVSLPFNLGIGGAVQTGFKFAGKYGFDFVVRVDGDGQHDVSYLENLIKPVLNNEADMTIGSRFIAPYVGYRSSFVRRIGINFFASLISFLTRNKVTDPTSGFCAYNKKMINIFASQYSPDFPEPEAIVVAGHYGARVKEVPVQMRKRFKGNSSIRYLSTLYYMLKVTGAILLVKLRQRKNG